MAGPRQLVSPPTFVDRNYGLLSVVQARYDEPDAHWRNGVTWQDICGTAGSTYDPYCVTGGGPPPKVGNVDVETFGATPFTVFAEVECSPVGYSQAEQRARAVDALTRNESYQVERIFWTGSAAASGTGATSYPHLSASADVTDTLGITLQCAATSVSGSVVLDITEGLGRLEAAFAACWNGQGIIHVPAILGPALFQWGLVKVENAQIKTQSGNLVALGAGYPGTSPAGVATPNVAWIYATAPVFAYRSAPETFTFKEQLNRDNNLLQTIVERTYVLGYTCCCTYALPISVGGDITGQPLSAS